MREGRKGGRTAGFILVDVIVALAVAGTALTMVIGGIAQAGRVAEIAAARIGHLVEAENGQAGSVGQILTIKK